MHLGLGDLSAYHTHALEAQQIIWCVIVFSLAVIHQEVPCQACDESAPLPPLTDFQKAAALVSEHSTKLAALFASPPSLPSAMNCTAAACAMEQAAANLTATYLHISPIYGTRDCLFLKIPFNFVSIKIFCLLLVHMDDQVSILVVGVLCSVQYNVHVLPQSAGERLFNR